MTAVSGRVAEFRKRECDVLAISTDSVETHERWLARPPAQGGVGLLNFPLASDESGDGCRAYGVYVARQNLALRGLFMIDPNGVLQYQVVHSLSVGRSTDEVLRVLDALQSGGLCPGDWAPGQPPLDPGATLGPDAVLGPYRIEAVLGSGSFGTVFRAWDTTLERRVALKVVQTRGPTPAEAVLAEARAAAALNHPNVCIVHAVDTGEVAPMIVMEYVDGRPLSDLLDAGPLPRAQAAALGRQIALGMAAAHAQHIIHGDLKPGNVLVTPDGTAKIMDFGLARRARSTDGTAAPASPPAQGAVSGTPSYMSPEQTRGQTLTPASDVFSLGLILYEMATGRRAVPDGMILEVLGQIGRLDPERLAAETSEPFAGIVRQALVGDPARRRITMGGIAELLV